MEEAAGKVGLKLNAQKCKVMKVNSKKKEPIKVGQKAAEEVECFTYLGANVTQDGGGTVDIRKRLALANAAFRKLSKVLLATNIGRKTKATLFKSLVLSVLLYGCETWKLTKEEENRLDTFQTKCLRRIFRIRWQDHKTNKEILEIANTGKVSDEVRRRRWAWIGHILRKDPGNDCAVALGWTPEGKRGRGRPKTTWRRMVEKERDSEGWHSWERARRVAQDREKWRDHVQALCASWHREN